jgi:hypothetical protein
LQPPIEQFSLVATVGYSRYPASGLGAEFFWLTVTGWRDKQNIAFDPDHAVVVELGLKYQV